MRNMAFWNTKMTIGFALTIAALFVAVLLLFVLIGTYLGRYVALALLSLCSLIAGIAFWKSGKKDIGDIYDNSEILKGGDNESE